MELTCDQVTVTQDWCVSALNFAAAEQKNEQHPVRVNLQSFHYATPDYALAGDSTSNPIIEAGDKPKRKSSLCVEAIPLEIWFKIIIPLAVQSEIDDYALSQVKPKLISNKLPLLCNTRNHVSDIIQYESSPFRNRDPIVALGLTCRHLWLLFGNYLFFYRPSNFDALDRKLTRCCMRFLSALESAAASRPSETNLLIKEEQGNFYTSDLTEEKVSPSVIRLHSRILVECILAIPNCKWSRLMVFDLLYLKFRLYVTSRVFLELPGPTYHRSNVSRRMQILSSLALYGLNLRDNEARESVLKLYTDLRRFVTSRKISSSQLIPSGSCGQELQTLPDQLRQHICFSGVKRRHSFTVENLVSIVTKANQIRSMPPEYAHQIVLLKPSRKLIWRYIHPTGVLMEVSPIDRQIVSFQETRRFELILQVIGICVPRPLTELEVLWNHELNFVLVNVFFELHLVTYLAPHLVIDSQLSHFLKHFAGLVADSMGIARAERAASSKKGLFKICSKLPLRRSKAVDTSYVCMSGIVNIIATCYMYQLLDPLIVMKELGIFDSSTWCFWGISRRLTSALQSAFIVRPRNWDVAGHLYDICSSLLRSDPEAKDSHCHPFLAPAIFYRWTKNLHLVGLQSSCVFSCYGINEHTASTDFCYPFFPILRPALRPGCPSPCPFLDLEISLIRYVMAKSNFKQLNSLCAHVANLEVLVRCISAHNSQTFAFGGEKDMAPQLSRATSETILETVIASMSSLPHRLASENLEYSLLTTPKQQQSHSNTINNDNLAALRAWVLIFSELVSHTERNWDVSNSARSEPPSDAVDESISQQQHDFHRSTTDLEPHSHRFYSNLYYHMLKHLVEWRPFFRHDKVALLWWNSLICKDIADMSKNTNAILYLSEIVFKVGCIPLAVSIIKHLAIMFTTPTTTITHTGRSALPCPISKFKPQILKMSKKILKFFLESPSASLVLWKTVLNDYSVLLLPALFRQRELWLKHVSLSSIDPSTISAYSSSLAHRNTLEVWKLSQFRTKIRRRYQKAVHSSLPVISLLLNSVLVRILPDELLVAIAQFLASEATRKDLWTTAAQLLYKIDRILGRKENTH
ncbi:uncharacterized protein LOC126324538 [Schistocerca gregaria]|uniref:uncharacterized protein LOC126324538 n=1 Tax=Schistocerca gregaria TaxID=7010 RepID=UPI00211E39FB|nr:uncharacterized protein LOC126324538 [Schistocerca gregaria]